MEKGGRAEPSKQLVGRGGRGEALEVRVQKTSMMVRAGEGWSDEAGKTSSWWAVGAREAGAHSWRESETLGTK